MRAAVAAGDFAGKLRAGPRPREFAGGCGHSGIRRDQIAGATGSAAVLDGRSIGGAFCCAQTRSWRGIRRYGSRARGSAEAARNRGVCAGAGAWAFATSGRGGSRAPQRGCAQDQDRGIEAAYRAAQFTSLINVPSGANADSKCVREILDDSDRGITRAVLARRGVRGATASRRNEPCPGARRDRPDSTYR